MVGKQPRYLWVSSSSIGDFQKCPRLYYLRNIYRDPITNHKISLVNPSMSLGQVIHQVIEELANLPQEVRLIEPLEDRFEKAWKKISGRAGGFISNDEEATYQKRGREMMKRIAKKPGPIARKAIKTSSLSKEENFPGAPINYFLSKEEGIVLCGKIDWLEYLPEDDSVGIIDFKTGQQEEKEESLQLPIYYLLASHCQKRKVRQVSYWYLDKDDQPVALTPPEGKTADRNVLYITHQIKEARLNKKLHCPNGGCFACRPYEQILAGRAQLVGVDGYQDLYILPT